MMVLSPFVDDNVVRERIRSERSKLVLPKSWHF